MMRDRSESTVAWRTVLDHERPVPPLPDFTRARALARAREATSHPLRVPLTIRGAAAPRWTMALAVAGTSLGTLLVAHAFERRARQQPAAIIVQAEGPGEAEARASRRRTTSDLPTRPVPENTSIQGTALARHHARRATPSRDELLVMQRARAAVTANDFVTAHSALTEHARRFPTGQLAEEREALRVKTLIGLDRPQEAREAAHAFETRFPSSVLRPAVSRLTSAP